jgi:hypothetical protein
MRSTYRFRRSIRIVTFPTAGIYRDACQGTHTINKCKDEDVTIKAHLFSHVRLKVLISRDVHAHAPVLQRSCRDLIRGTRHGRNDDVRNREAPRKVERGRRRAHDVVRVECATHCCCWPTFPAGRRRRCSGRSGPLCVLLYRIDIDGEDARTVVREESR